MSDQEKLKFFQDLYTEARSYAEETYEAMDRHLKQYQGDDAIDGSNTKATAVRNITYELVESQVSTYIPTPSVRPKLWSEKTERNAKAIETMLINKRDDLPYEKLNDLDERFNPIYGASVWLPEWDDSVTTYHTVGDINLSCFAPKKFTGQPNIYDTRDMEYEFLEFETTKDEIVRRYGVSPETAEDTESDTGTSNDKTATIYVCFYKNEDDCVCQFIWSGDTTLSDVTDYFARKRKVCRKCGKREQICECDHSDLELESEEYEELDHDIVLSDGSILPAMSVVIKDGQIVTETVTVQEEIDGQLVFNYVNGIPVPKMIEVQKPKYEPTRIPFYKPNILPAVIRKNTSEEDSLFGQSDCGVIRPQQQAINKIESRILTKIMRSGVTPYMPEDAKITRNNEIFGEVIRMKAGETASMYGTIDNEPNIAQDIAQSDRLYDQAKRILGISASFQGQHDASAQSGYAKQLQIQQSSGRLDSKRQMKNAAHAEIDKIIFQYYLAYADEPRPATYRDTEGRIQNTRFNRYDFVERDLWTGEYYYNDEYMFSADATADIERNRQLMWQENRQNFQTGAYGNPALPETLLTFWLAMEKAHYPGAHENVERIRMSIQQQQQLQQQMQMQQQQTPQQMTGGMM